MAEPVYYAWLHRCSSSARKVNNIYTCWRCPLPACSVAVLPADWASACLWLCRVPEAAVHMPRIPSVTSCSVSRLLTLQSITMMAAHGGAFL